MKNNKIVKRVICGFLIAVALVLEGVVVTNTTDPRDPPVQGTNTTIQQFNHLG